MLRIAILTTLLVIATPAFAQPGGPSRGGGSVPAVGTMLPEVTAIDEQGKEFSTASLRGKHTVLVFGCLT